MLEEVKDVEREVEVEKSSIRAMKVVCSLKIRIVNTKGTYCSSLYLGAMPGTLPMTRGVQPFA